MVRPRIPVAERRVKVSIHPKPDILAWVDEQVAAGVYYNRIDAFEKGMKLERERLLKECFG